MKYIYIVLLAFVVVSCNKKMDVEVPDFNVEVEKQTYKIGDTVRFKFSGKTENITFYSGKPGSEYEHRNRTELEGGTPQLEIVTQYGGGGTQVNSLRLKVCSDLTGLSKQAIIDADWKDINHKATIATNATITPSGTIDVSEWIEPGKPLYFAFQFVGETLPAAAGNWIIRDFKANISLQDGTVLPIANLQNAQWLPFSIKNDANAWYSRGNPIVDVVIIGGGANAPESEDWFLSKPLYFKKVAPDIGLPIQYISGNVLSHYDFTQYTEPGVYNVTFVASNANADDQKSVIKQLQITIEP